MTRTPVIPCRHIGLSGTIPQWRFWGPHCRAYHHHGGHPDQNGEIGHRVAHCHCAHIPIPGNRLHPISLVRRLRVVNNTRFRTPSIAPSIGRNHLPSPMRSVVRSPLPSGSIAPSIGLLRSPHTPIAIEAASRAHSTRAPTGCAGASPRRTTHDRTQPCEPQQLVDALFREARAQQAGTPHQPRRPPERSDAKSKPR
jgi:hypothetical protein